MGKILLNLSVLLLIGACGARSNPTIDPEFTVYVTAFESATNHHVQSSIGFGDPGNGHAAICNYATLQITVDEAFWNGAPTEEREALVFHELGHCEFLLKHDTNEIAFPEPAFGSDQSEPESVMYPTVIPDWEWKEHREYYIKQLLDAAKANHAVI